MKNKDISTLSQEEREELATNPNTPADTLGILSVDENLWVRFEVSENPNTPERALRTLAGDKNSEVRENVAQNPNASKGALSLLAVDEHTWVRVYVAANKNTPKSVLLLLSGDADLRVRENVVRNPTTPADALVILRDSGNSNMCKNVIMHPNAPKDLCLSIYNEAVKQDMLDERLAAEIVQRNVLDQTELLALVALYGERLAQTVAENVPVERNSLLEKILAKYNCQAKIRPVEKEAGLARS